MRRMRVKIWASVYFIVSPIASGWVGEMIIKIGYFDINLIGIDVVFQNMLCL
jgi:hypothetical protein